MKATSQARAMRIRKAQFTAVALRESHRRMIEDWLRKPMRRRTAFLRVRLPGGGSCL